MNNPVKPSIKTEVLPTLFILITFGLAYYFYNNFPEIIPIHWNIKGEVDNYGPRWVGAVLLPVTILVLYLLLLTLPMLDPKKEKYAQFKKPYNIIKASFIFFMLGVYVVSGFKTLGVNLRMEVWIPGMVGLLFIVLGNYMAKIKNNWFIGIRTPWTLSSEKVWNKTHRLGGKIFVVGGIVMIILNFFPTTFQMPIFFVMVATMVLVPTVYSYLIFKNYETRKDENNK